MLPNYQAKVITTCAAAALLIISSASAGCAASTWGEQQLLDDTLIVVTKQNTGDTRRLKADLKGKAHATAIMELHAINDNWSILHVTPQSGQREQTLNIIN